MMRYIDDFVQNTRRLKQIKEENKRLSEERSKILRGHDSLADLAFQEAGFEPTSIETKISEGTIYKHEQTDIYIHHDVDEMRVWIMPDDTDEFMKYLENGEFVKEGSIKYHYNQKIDRFGFGMGLGVGAIVGSVNMIISSFNQSPPYESVAIALGGMLLGMGVGAIVDIFRNKRTRRNLREALERHERFKPKYEGDMAFDYLLKAYGTRDLNLNS